jgi:beta-glucosidase
MPDAEITYVAGVAIEGADIDGIATAVDLTRKSDAIILCVGEGATMSGEAASRAHPGLPGRQRELAEAVLSAAAEEGTPVIAVLFSGRPLIVPWLFERSAAVIAAWFLGTEAGNAIADVITGRVSPSGRTPVSWARAVGQIPIFFGQRPNGRPANPTDHFTSKYLDVPNSPLFAFGAGLTYGRFTLSDLSVRPTSVHEPDTFHISVDVVNAGAVAATETVFLFVHDKIASVARPVLELKGFQKITLAPGERGVVHVSINAADLRFLGQDLEPVFESGDVEVLVGPCADRDRLLCATVKLRAKGLSGSPPGGA